MTAVSDLFRSRWGSGKHLGEAKPVQFVQVRRGQMKRGYNTWEGPPVPAKIPKEKAAKPWMAWWVPTTPWKLVPGVFTTEVTQDFTSQGLAMATLSIENTSLVQTSNMGIIYHLIERGALSPYRGYTPPGLPLSEDVPNEWQNMLVENAQIRIYQGYGLDTQVPVFTGLIDDVDPVDNPDRLTITCRDFGQFLTDQRCFGFVNGPGVIDPVIFRAKKPKKTNTVGVPVGYAANASSRQTGHPPRFVTDKNKKSYWSSHVSDVEMNTEYVEVLVPKGRYESVHIDPTWGASEIFVGVYAQNHGIPDQEKCELDGMNIHSGWVTVPADEGGGTVPGDLHGGWPYLKRWNSMSGTPLTFRLDHTLEVGDNTLFRLGFRKLNKTPHGKYQVSITRFAPVRQESRREYVYRYVGHDATSSSHQIDEQDRYHSSNVLDDLRATEWHSEAKSEREDTEWIQIRLPQGRYRSFRLHTRVDNMEMFVGVYAKNRRRKKGKKKNTYETYPAQVNNIDVAEGWVNLDMGTVPGGTDGGWPYIVHVDDVHKMTEKSVSFSFPHELELGHDSIIRVGFRHLHPIGGGKYRAVVGKLHGVTRSLVKDDKKKDAAKKSQIIEVDDPSDIVRVVLRWAGFQEWVIENTGTKLKGDWVFNRQTTLREIIKKVEEMTGYIFYIAPPYNTDLSIGTPTFRSSYLLRDDLPDIPYLRDDQLLTGVSAKLTDENLASIIRVRGDFLSKKKGGQQYSIEKEYRVMGTYRPPWWPLSGLLRHVVHYEPRLKDQTSVDVMARLIALQQALSQATATIEIPGTPEHDLDWQVAIRDASTGLNTRLYIARRSTVFQTGVRPGFKTTLGGALLDTPYIVGVKKDLADLVPLGQAVASIGDVDLGIEVD